jgi:hypothetical protein
MKRLIVSFGWLSGFGFALIATEDYMEIMLGFIVVTIEKPYIEFIPEDEE